MSGHGRQGGPGQQPGPLPARAPRARDACSDLPQVVDFVGYGTANDWAGAGAAARRPSNTDLGVAQQPPAPTRPTTRPTSPRAPPPRALRRRRRLPARRSPHDHRRGAGHRLRPRRSSARTSSSRVSSPRPTRPAASTASTSRPQGTGPEPSASGASDGVFVFQAASGALDADAVVGNYVEVTGQGQRVQRPDRDHRGSGRHRRRGRGVQPRAGADHPVADAPTPVVSRSRACSSSPPVTTPSPTPSPPTSSARSAWPSGDHPLLQSTEVAAPGSARGRRGRGGQRQARGHPRRRCLDATSRPAASARRSAAPARSRACSTVDLTPAYVSNTEPVRVGAAATFSAPVVVDFRFNLWRFQPTAQVVGPDNAASPVTLRQHPHRGAGQRRHQPARHGRPQGRVVQRAQLLHRPGRPGPRPARPTRTATATATTSGTAATSAAPGMPQDLARQTEKEVSAINALDADIVGLMEIENSAQVRSLARRPPSPPSWPRSTPRPAPAPGRSSRRPTELPSADAAGLHHQRRSSTSPAKVMRVDRSRAPSATRARTGQAFGNAREPIAQVFKSKNAKGDKFLFVVNHFKSKGRRGRSPATRTPVTARAPR